MSDQRKSVRGRSYLGGTMMFNHGYSTMDCLVLNLSRSGAKLTFTNTVTVPGEFDLTIEQKGGSRKARMIWRRQDEVGVKFIEDDASMPVSLEWARRLRAAEAKNHALRLRIEALTSA